MSTQTSILTIPVTAENADRSISVTQADTWARNWRQSDHHLNANSFLLNADDFRKVLEDPSVKYIRLYIGLNMSADNTITGEKLFWVGAGDDEKNIINTSNPNQPAGIYDYGSPCPPRCDGEDTENPFKID